MYYTYNDYINNNDIAIEGFLSKALSKLQTLFAKLILKIDKMVKRMKDNRLKKVLTNLLSRAKRGLAKCKSLNEHNPDMVRELQEEYNEINEEVQEVVKEDATKEEGNDSDTEVQGDKTIIYTDDSKKTIGMIRYKDGHYEAYDDGKLDHIDYEYCPSEKNIKTKWFEDDGKTIDTINYKDGHTESYQNGKFDYIAYGDCPSEKEIRTKYFKDDGKTIDMIDYKDGHTEYYENGKLDKISYVDCPSERKIEWKTFEDDGKTIRKIDYKDGHSVRYENGQPVNESYSSLTDFMNYSAMMITENIL